MVLSTLLLDDIRDNTKTRMQNTFLFGAVGDSSTTPAAADTTLGNETFRSAVDAFDSSVTNAITASLTVGASENNGSDIKEGGWLDANSGGNLWTHNTLTTIAKTSSIQVFLDTTIVIEVTET